MVWVCFYLNVPCAIVFTCILGSSKSLYKYKDAACSTQCPLSRSVWAKASCQERNPASAREERSFLFASAGHSLPWRVDKPSIYSLKEDCLLRREPQGHTQVAFGSPRAFINHRRHKKILSVMATALPHQEGLINELQFQWPLKYTRLIIFHEMLTAFWLITGLRHNLLMSLKLFSPFNCFSPLSFPSFSTSGFGVD